MRHARLYSRSTPFHRWVVAARRPHSSAPTEVPSTISRITNVGNILSACRAVWLYVSSCYALAAFSAAGLLESLVRFGVVHTEFKLDFEKAKGIRLLAAWTFNNVPSVDNTKRAVFCRPWTWSTFKVASCTATK